LLRHCAISRLGFFFFSGYQSSLHSHNTRENAINSLNDCMWINYQSMIYRATLCIPNVLKLNKTRKNKLKKFLEEFPKKKKEIEYKRVQVIITMWSNRYIHIATRCGKRHKNLSAKSYNETENNSKSCHEILFYNVVFHNNRIIAFFII